MPQIDQILQRLTPRRGTLIVALQEIQALLGHIPRERIPEIARAFGLTDAEVFGVISFYTDLHLERQGDTVVRVCCGDSCAACDGYAILDSVCRRLGVSPESTTADGKATVRIAYCLGNCALSPSMMIGDRVYGRLTPGRAAQVVEQNIG